MKHFKAENFSLILLEIIFIICNIFYLYETLKRFYNAWINVSKTDKTLVITKNETRGLKILKSLGINYKKLLHRNKVKIIPKVVYRSTNV